jgi:hypothetical protein
MVKHYEPEYPELIEPPTTRFRNARDYIEKKNYLDRSILIDVEGDNELTDVNSWWMNTDGIALISCNDDVGCGSQTRNFIKAMNHFKSKGIVLNLETIPAKKDVDGNKISSRLIRKKIAEKA